MGLKDLKYEVLKPAYIMCNECKFLNDDVICEKYNTFPPRKVTDGNKFKERENKEVCKYFERK